MCAAMMASGLGCAQSVGAPPLTTPGGIGPERTAPGQATAGTTAAAVEVAGVRAEVRELTFRDGAVILSGTLLLPPGSDAVPAVVLVHGSGPETRTPYLADAALFVASGVAALVFDKRGTGASDGDWRTASLDDLANDVAAAVQALRLQSGIDVDRVGAWGVSQGGWMLPWVAQRADLAFLVQVTAAATPLGDQERWRVAQAMTARGFDARAVSATDQALRVLLRSRPLLAPLLPRDTLSLLAYDPLRDPATVWPSVRAPVLAFVAGRDSLVPSDRTLAVLAAVLKRRGDTRDRLVMLPDAGHGLGGASRVADPRYREALLDWTTAVLAGTPPPTTVTAARAGAAPAVVVAPAQEEAGAGDHLELSIHRVGARTGAATDWWHTPYVQLPLAAAFVLVFLAGLAASLVPARRRRHNRLQPRTVGVTHTGWRDDAPRGAFWVRVWQGVVSLVDLALLVGWAHTLWFLLGADLRGATPPVPYAHELRTLSLVSAVAVLLLAASIVASPSAGWVGWRRRTAVLVGLAAAGFLPFVILWELPFLVS
jgi:dienelactone hydrolase